jgi:signal transduction histidine kinase
MLQRASTIRMTRLQSLHGRQVLLLAASLIYAAIFLGSGGQAAITALSLVPSILAGWLFGMSGGLSAALLLALLNIVLYNLTGQPGLALTIEQWPGVIGSLFLSGGAGWISGLLQQVRTQRLALEQEREALLKEIKAREQVEQALILARDAAEQADRAKSVFLANMSHELRTPLTVIIGYSDLLALQVQGDEQRNDLKRVQRAGRHLLAMINSVLDLSKIEQGQVELEIAPIHLESLIGEAAEIVGALVERRQNHLVIECDQRLDMVLTDAMRLRQILINLLENAAKFTEGGLIKLQVRPVDSGRVLLFEIADNGSGIPAADLPKLFTPFTQASTVQGPIHGGTGLGLALSRHLCRLMGGDMSLESTEGKGTTVRFTIEIPTAAPALQIGPQADAPQPQSK